MQARGGLAAGPSSNIATCRTWDKSAWVCLAVASPPSRDRLLHGLASRRCGITGW